MVPDEDDDREGVEAEYDTAAPPPNADSLPDRRTDDSDVPVIDFEEDDDAGA